MYFEVENGQQRITEQITKLDFEINNISQVSACKLVYDIEICEWSLSTILIIHNNR